jgi:hypothetical protein
MEETPQETPDPQTQNDEFLVLWAWFQQLCFFEKIAFFGHCFEFGLLDEVYVVYCASNFVSVHPVLSSQGPDKLTPNTKYLINRLPRLLSQILRPTPNTVNPVTGTVPFLNSLTHNPQKINNRELFGFFQSYARWLMLGGKFSRDNLEEIKFFIDGMF